MAKSVKVVVSAALIAVGQLSAKTAQNPSAEWFRDAQYGLFIHWGCYAVPAKGEWYLNSSQMDPAEYARFAEEFSASRFDVADWVEKIKRWRMKYVVFTTRHHDGYAMWDSALNPFNCMKVGPKRDILGELVPALREAGIRVGYYYSPANWSNPDYAGYKVKGWPRGNAWKDAAARRRFVAYYKAELEEIFSKYGAPDYLWWDGCLPENGSLEGASLLRDLRTKYPNVIWNDRLGEPFDVKSREQEVRKADNVMWESCMTLNGHWGYYAGDNRWKSRREVVDMLLACASGGGNLLLNVGPKEDGSIPDGAVAVLDEVGSYLGRLGVEDALRGYGDAVANLGDERGLRRVIDKAERGEDIRIAVMGGSITAGAGASSPDSRWADVFLRGWKELFPDAGFELKNCGIGATGSDIGAFRYSRDVEPFKPDLVVFEFSVNDADAPMSERTMRGLIRHAMRCGASVMTLGMSRSNGGSAQKWHLKVAKEQGVPFVSYRDAVWPRVASGKIAWKDLAVDSVHPGDRGHAIAGELLNLFVRDALRRYDIDRKSKIQVSNPAVWEQFEKGRVVPFASVEGADATGFATSDEPHWGLGLVATKAGARIAFTVDASTVGIIYSKSRDRFGRLRVVVDGVVQQDSPTAYADINYWWTPVHWLVNGKSGRHRVELEVLPGDNGGADAANLFKLCALLVEK